MKQVKKERFLFSCIPKKEKVCISQELDAWRKLCKCSRAELIQKICKNYKSKNYNEVKFTIQEKYNGFS